MNQAHKTFLDIPTEVFEFPTKPPTTMNLNQTINGNETKEYWTTLPIDTTYNANRTHEIIPPFILSGAEYRVRQCFSNSIS